MHRDSAKYAQEQDQQDPLRHLREQFVIPSKADLHRKTLHSVPGTQPGADEHSVYLCGQFSRVAAIRLPRSTSSSTSKHGPAKECLAISRRSRMSQSGALAASSIAQLKRDTRSYSKERHSPSDHYAVDSHIRHHELDPEEAMILIEPKTKENPILDTDYIKSIIDKHAENDRSPAITWHPILHGTILRHAHNHLLRAKQRHHSRLGPRTPRLGNVLCSCTSWNVDFAVWCTYKYLNCGPGSIGGAFVHERHGQVTAKSAGPHGESRFDYRPRLSGWWAPRKPLGSRWRTSFIPSPARRVSSSATLP
ncbi:hypothetical protein BTJ68_10533 [Hortaea werneckii EXF-2000]|uniref:Aminotransferase class V domain-containing protein n=1 Tax=Hortaea werneckii EXF-2000 TaxID=1157616 RepID=A0A1Z5SYE6_HORWE|nr:hypothetical protein BTJ68_10533 [Hortaea werneckii EXF-2000]